MAHSDKKTPSCMPWNIFPLEWQCGEYLVSIIHPTSSLCDLQQLAGSRLDWGAEANNELVSILHPTSSLCDIQQWAGSRLDWGAEASEYPW